MTKEEVERKAKIKEQKAADDFLAKQAHLQARMIITGIQAHATEYPYSDPDFVAQVETEAKAKKEDTL